MWLLNNKLVYFDYELNYLDEVNVLIFYYYEKVTNLKYYSSYMGICKCLSCYAINSPMTLLENIIKKLIHFVTSPV